MAKARKDRGLRETGTRYAAPNRALRRLSAWKLEDAKARFSEVVRRACSEGPQRVTRRGADAVVVIAAEDYAKLLPDRSRRESLVDFLRSTALGEIAIERPLDRGRKLDL